MRFSAGSTAVFIRWSSTSVMNGCDIRIPEGVRIRIRLFGDYGIVEFAESYTSAPLPRSHPTLRVARTFAAGQQACRYSRQTPQWRICRRTRENTACWIIQLGILLLVAIPT